jgi:hypothetical protein
VLQPTYNDKINENLLGKSVVIFRILFWTILVILFCSLSGCSTDRTFKGKVVDAETLEPIEGAVIVAVWNKERFGGLLHDIRLKDARETLTDENGDWTLIGLEGQNSKFRRFLQYVGIFRTLNPEFFIYKSGYTEYVALGNFSAWPCLSREPNLEGIILIRPGNTKGERRQFFQKYKFQMPFISVKNPENKLRMMEFSFEYPKEINTVNSIWCKEKHIIQNWVFTVVGIRKAKTRKEMLEAFRRLPSDERLPITRMLQKEERERLFDPIRKNLLRG